MKVNKICETCGKAFTCFRSQDRRFCSRDCWKTQEKPALIDVFYEHVGRKQASGCILWAGPVNGKGYGQMGYDYENLMAHRVSYELFVGPIPEGLHVLHRCDTPGCINPTHLFVGTQSDNVQDMLDKGRGGDRHGERSGTAKLSEEQVLAIRTRYAQGDITQAELASEYSVSRPTITVIITGRNWAHLDGADTKDNRKGPVKRGKRAEFLGANVPTSKLSDEQVLLIRSLYAQGGVTQDALSKQFGVSTANISMILSRRTWTHL